MSHIPKPYESRDYHRQQVSFLRFNYTSEYSDRTVAVGRIPPGAIILSMKMYVKTLFPEAKLSLGNGADDKYFGEKDVKAIGPQDFTLSDAKMFAPDDKELAIFAKLDKKVASGDGILVVQFVTKR